MSKLVYFIIPFGILCSGIAITQSHRSGPLPTNQFDELKHLSAQVSVINTDAPIGLNFSGERVPLEDKRVNKRMEREINKNMKYQAATMQTFKRAYRYKDDFLKTLKRKGIPEDFFYMAVAESNLSNAKSPVGARGFWQFMRSTAAYYGLEVSAKVDERYHPEKATAAACQYLLDAHKQLESWTLVAAAYNMGSGGIQKAMRRNGHRDYYRLDLNRETSQYMYRILGYKVIMEEPFRFGFSLNERKMYRPIPYYTVNVTQSIEDLVAFAHDNDHTYRELKTLNPWLISDHLEVAEGKTYSIRFPLTKEWDAKEMLVENADKLDQIDAAYLMKAEVSTDEGIASAAK